MKAQIRRTYLTEIPHSGGNLSFQHPAFRGTYGNLAKQIDSEGLLRPTSAQTASLVYDAIQNPNGKFEKEITQILKDSWLVEFTGNLYLPKKAGEEVHNGVIIEDNPIIENGRLVMNKNTLIERLKNNDSAVRFVPFGYKIDAQLVDELRKNPYIIARYGGEEGANKIAELASRYKLNPKVWSFKSVDSEIARKSALVGGVWDFGGGLLVDGDDWYDGDGGRAFGVKK